LCNKPIVQLEVLNNLTDVVDKFYIPRDEEVVTPAIVKLGRIKNKVGFLATDFFGVLIYKGGRLYEWGKYGCQVQIKNNLGKDTVGVINFDALGVAANKESFLNGKLLNSFITMLGLFIKRSDPNSQKNDEIKAAAKKKKQQDAYNLKYAVELEAIKKDAEKDAEKAEKRKEQELREIEQRKEEAEARARHAEEKLKQMERQREQQIPVATVVFPNAVVAAAPAPVEEVAEPPLRQRLRARNPVASLSLPPPPALNSSSRPRPAPLKKRGRNDDEERVAEPRSVEVPKKTKGAENSFPGSTITEFISSLSETHKECHIQTITVLVGLSNGTVEKKVFPNNLQKEPAPK
jgi:hypothetical protein